MDDDSIDLVVTSPPYDNLRDYQGYHFPFEDIARSLFRVMKKGGVVVWVVGDQTVNGSETGTSFRQALYFNEIGFNLHDTMVWNKMSQACHDYRNKRYKQEFEYMIILSNGKPKTYNEICDREVKNAGKIIKKSSKRKADGTIRKYREIKLKDKHARSNIWCFEVERRSKHPAPFPEALVYDHIKSWSNVGDIVYDPFMGSGTTANVAIILQRKYIGSEISSEYCQLAEKRIQNEKRQDRFNLTV